MQAAISANKYGHDVTLFEKNDKLGGQLNLAIKPLYKENNFLLEYLLNKIKKYNIRTFTGEEVNLEKIRELNPNAIIVATGAKEMKLNCVEDTCQDNIFTCWQVIENPKILGKRVVVIGGGSTGCELAEILTGQKIEFEFIGMEGQGPSVKYNVTKITEIDKKREVAIIEMLEDLATDQAEHNRELLLVRLKEAGVKIVNNAKVQGLKGNILTYIDTKKIEIKTIEADSFVISVGVFADNKIANELRNAGFHFLEIGDCKKPRKIAEALY